MTDAAGKVIYRIAYGAYGELEDITDAAGQTITLKESGLRFLYNGRYGVETDTDGLYYMRARYYNPQIKRFINRDILSGSIDNSKSLNRYSYVQGKPISLTDPFGLCPEWSQLGHTVLDILGVFFDGLDVVNGLWYLAEGDTANAVRCFIGAIPALGSGISGALRIGGKYLKAADYIETSSRIIGNGVMCADNIGSTIAAYQHAKNAYARGELESVDVLNVVAGIAATGISGRETVTAARQLRTAIKYHKAVGNVKTSVGDGAKRMTAGKTSGGSGSDGTSRATARAASASAGGGSSNLNTSYGKSSADFDYYMDLANRLDVSTPRNGAAFYSGPGNRARATDFANQNGKFTLETTVGGKYLDSLNLYDRLPKEQADMIWKRMSERYAQGATGNVYGFVNGSNAGSIFNTVEYPTLLQNKNVTNIFTELFN